MVNLLNLSGQGIRVQQKMGKQNSSLT